MQQILGFTFGSLSKANSGWLSGRDALKLALWGTYGIISLYTTIQADTLHTYTPKGQ